MITTTVLNQKGGVGKTSTTFHLTGALSLMGKRVLVLDNDPQSSLTQVLFGAAAALAIDPAESIAAIYSDDADPGRVIRPTCVPGLDLVAGSKAATLANVPDLDSLEPDRARVLGDFLDHVGDQYDYCLIDCPSNLQFLSYAALVASDQVLIPIVPEDLGTQGIVGVEELITRAQAEHNPGLRVVGYLLSMMTKKGIHAIFEENLRRGYGDQIFVASIPSAAAYVEAIAHGLPINKHKPKGVPAARMGDLAVELIGRSESIAAKLASEIDPVEELV